MKNNRIHTFFLFGLIIAVGVGVYFIFKPFLIAIFLGFILSQLFKGWYEKTHKIIKNKSVASLTMCFAVILMLVIPFLAVLGLITNEANDFYQGLQKNEWQLDLENLAEKMPILEKWGIDIENISFKSLIVSSRSTSEAKDAGTFIISIIAKTYQGISGFLFIFFVTFFILYYFFKDGDRIIKRLMRLSPLANKKEEVLINNFIEISKATLKGSLVIAIIQGTLLGLLFWVTGIPSPVIWGVVATILSLIPLVGAGLIWAPVGIYMLFTGQIWQAIVILLFGALVISTIDNFLRPRLVGNSSSLHPLLVFLSTIGGIYVFGILGFLIGPVVVVLFLSLLKIYESEFKTELKQINK